ncbi:DUF5999 family protein [Streptomyces sp. NBC_01237]|uniref:DUF5999 family protein n=1 Tax=Streptomyces sp. NBC_01237 TaxID=2903790 RepID=UPI002DDC6169|nr:DUF5999 family protein [Streptomyces sp. NBC_01237]WRZ77277.1 DUF5999 family protein [Streptomyces sp. NBC_01237]
MCQHTPTCPTADAADREAARTEMRAQAQGWSLLCNGVLLFEDTGELLPDGRIIAPHRPGRGRVMSPSASMPLEALAAQKLVP